MGREETGPGVRPQWVLRTLLGGAVAVGAVAMAASAVTLAELGHAVGWVQWDGRLSWSLPVAVDLLALVAGAVWLSPGMTARSRSLARGITLGAVAGSVALNAIGHLVESGDMKVTPLLRIAVSAVPPLVAALVVHLVGVVLAPVPGADHGQDQAVELEEQREAATISAAHDPADGTTADRHDGTTARNAPAPQPRPAPAPDAPVRVPAAPAADARTAADDTPAPPPVPAAAQTGPPRVTARLGDRPDDSQIWERPAPVRDWDRPDLPADCAPGTEPLLLTPDQSRARILWALQNTDWTQKRIGEFAGRSASVVNTRKAEAIRDGILI